ncbi:MAG TPA: MAPEG family protein [Caulobacteraceae bacterium]|nr:MAPEG family protein [Caulobacteraceae bacterium]
MDHDAALHMAAQAAGLWTALHLIVLLVLSLLVVRQRQVHHVAFGDEGVPSLARAIRAFGNAAEYIPAGVGGLIALALVSAPPMAIHIGGAVLLVGRLVHAAGLSRTGETSRLRSAGMLLTWLAYIFEVVALLIFALI